MKWTSVNIVVLIIFLLVAIVGYRFYVLTQGNTAKNEFHIHSDVLLIANGERVDLSETKYQSSGGTYLHPFLHLHDNDGDVAHFHRAKQSLRAFLNAVEVDEEIVNSDATVYVNGRVSKDGLEYVTKDVDRVLILVGSNYSKSDISEYLKQITDKSCIQSGKCPSRGAPSDEASCVAGSATGCSAIIRNEF